MKLELLAAALICGSSFGQGLPSANKTPYEETKNEGKELVAELTSRRPATDAQHLGTLKIRDEGGKRLEVPVRMTIELGKGAAWQDVYESQAVSGLQKQILVIKRTEGKPNRYFFGSTTEVASLKELTPQQVYQPFAQSDFWIADLGLDFLHWPSHKVVDKEMRHSRSCKVVESTRPAAASGYARVLSWIDNETGGLVRAEAFDYSGKRIKEFSIKSFKKVDGRWQLKEMEIINSLTDSRTRLEFNLEVAAE